MANLQTKFVCETVFIYSCELRNKVILVSTLYLAFDVHAYSTCACTCTVCIVQMAVKCMSHHCQYLVPSFVYSYSEVLYPGQDYLQKVKILKAIQGGRAAPLNIMPICSEFLNYEARERSYFLEEVGKTVAYSYPPYDDVLPTHEHTYTKQLLKANTVQRDKSFSNVLFLETNS